MKTIKKAVIIAGGKGTRLSGFSKVFPKALVKIGDKPVIEHQIELFREYGIKDIWVLSGHLGDQIKDYLGDGKKWKVKILYNQEEKPLGTAGAVGALAGRIKEDFLVLSGDVMLDFDVKKFSKFHLKPDSRIASIIVHANDHPLDSDLVEIDSKGEVLSLLKRSHKAGATFRNLSIASAYIFSPGIFRHIKKGRKSDIEKDLFPVIFKSNEKVFAYNTPEYIKDMGTLDRLRQVRQDYAVGKIKRLNLKNKRRAIFLDRDGVINKEVDQLSRVEDFKIYSSAAKNIKKMNDAEFLTIIATNQPMIAKGFMTEDDLNNMHKILETDLALEGAKIDAIYYCPHHPKKGFVGEVPELKINCNCRKPKPGMLFQAQKDFNIDLKESYLIGDKTSDILAGKQAGCKTILIKTGYKGKDNSFSAKPDFTVKDLAGTVRIINS